MHFVRAVARRHGALSPYARRDGIMLCSCPQLGLWLPTRAGESISVRRHLTAVACQTNESVFLSALVLGSVDRDAPRDNATIVQGTPVSLLDTCRFIGVSQEKSFNSHHRYRTCDPPCLAALRNHYSASASK